MENQMETAHPSVLEAQLEDLKRLLEGSAYCSGSVKPAPDDGKVDRCAELTETIATLQQQIQELTAIKSDAQGQRQNAAMTEQKNLIKILKESHEDRMRQITAFQQDMKASAQRSHAETLAALPRGNR